LVIAAQFFGTEDTPESGKTNLPESINAPSQRHSLYERAGGQRGSQSDMQEM
jgi:hypothetical protein